MMLRWSQRDCCQGVVISGEDAEGAASWREACWRCRFPRAVPRHSCTVVVAAPFAHGSLFASGSQPGNNSK